MQIRMTATDGTAADVVLLHEDDVTAYDAGEVFNPLMLEKFAGAGWLRSLKVIDTERHMKWDDRNRMTNCSWVKTPYRPDVWAGTTTNSGDDFTASLSGFTLTNGAIVQLATNTVPSTNAITYNINSTGAKPMYDLEGEATGYAVRYPQTNADRIQQLVYSSLFDAYFLVAGDNDASKLMPSSWPPELFIDLCAAVGAHPWICVPMLACDDPDMDFVTQLATYIRDTYPWMVPVWEANNELWNQTKVYFYIPNAEAARGLSTGQGADTNEWRGRAMSRIAQALYAVYGDTSLYEVNCAMQSGDGSASSNLSASLAAARYVSETGDSNDAASNWVSGGSIANYVENGLTLGGTLSDAADAWAAAATEDKPALLNAAIDTFAWATHKTRIVTWGAAFASAGLVFRQYEANIQPGPFDTGTANEQAFKAALIYATNIEYYWMDLLRNFRENGGVSPSIFQSAGNYQWAMWYPDIYAATPATMWTVFQNEIAKKRRMRLVLT